MNRNIKSLLVIAGAMAIRPFRLFPDTLDTNNPVPTPPRHSTSNSECDSFESARRHNAAVAKRHRRAEKLRRLEERKCATTSTI